MSKLDEMIQQYCPDGVEFKPIGDCVHKTQNIKWATADGSYSYIDLTSVDRDTHKITETQTINAGNAPSRAQQIVLEGDVLFATTRPTLKRYCLIDEEYDGQICSTGFCVLRAKESIVSPRWLFHVVSSSEFYYYVEANQKGASYPAISDKEVKQFKMPVPPLEVQSEIVRILDNFTELTAELTARKKQYEFYRDKLLTFGDVRGGATSDVVWRTLAEIADISTGSSNTDDAVEGGCYPFFVRSQQPLAKDEYEYDEEAIITAGDGVGVGKVFHYINGKYALHQRAYRIHPATDGLLGKYLYHYFVATFPKYIGQQMYQGSVPSIRRPMLNKFQVAIPSLDVQKRIVNVLDNFDAICSDLKIGLPAEIEARQKQYEFYRDALLTYAATGQIIAKQASKQASGV